MCQAALSGKGQASSSAEGESFLPPIDHEGNKLLLPVLDLVTAHGMCEYGVGGGEARVLQNPLNGLVDVVTQHGRQEISQHDLLHQLFEVVAVLVAV